MRENKNERDGNFSLKVLLSKNIDTLSILKKIGVN